MDFLSRNKAWLSTHFGIPLFLLAIFMYPENRESYLRYADYIAIGFFALVLSLTPLVTIFPRNAFFLKLNRYRRQFGVSVFSYAMIHILCYLLLVADITSIVDNAFRAAFIPVVWVAVPILLVMTLTSNRKSITLLGYQKWKKLHRLVYFAEFALIMHVSFMGRPDLVLYIFGPVVFLQLTRIIINWRRLH
jgi:methionine sulfoxide reductase heme-binding subunit